MLIFFPVSLSFSVDSQTIRQFNMYGDVKITIDIPENYNLQNRTLIILYALPAGNTTEQTMGKKMAEGEDWHFDIQHIKAQTGFIRKELAGQNIVVAYLDNNYKSWVSWKNKHPGYIAEVQHITDTVFSLFKSRKKALYLNGHSAGGRFIFSYLDGVSSIPPYIERISFLDSDYGYDSSYLIKLRTWLKANKRAELDVFAYNDSIALLNGKKFVSDTGGTWYRSHLMLRDLSPDFSFKKIRDDSLVFYNSANKRIRFIFKTNPDKKIFHTVQVERNGFIHSILIGTKMESKHYTYFGERAYGSFIE